MILTTRQHGFTLIELIIAVTIIGILLTIAVPMYTEQVKHARRADAKVALAELAQLQEIYHADNHSFADSLSSLKAEKQGFKKEGESYYSKEGYYALVVTSATANTFAMEARADTNGAQKDDVECKRFTMNALGEKQAYDDSNAISLKCW